MDKMISYHKLFKLIRDRKLTPYTLFTDLDIQPSTMHRLRHNESITMNTLLKICIALDVQPGDILEIVEKKGA